MSGEVTKRRVQIIDAMRKKSTQELLLIQLDNDRRKWSDSAFEAVRYVVRERSRNMAQFIEDCAQVRSSIEREHEASVSKALRGNWASSAKALFAKITGFKLSKSTRLGLTIAAGVCGGLLSYRLLTRLVEWLEENYAMSNLLICGSILAVFGISLFFVVKHRHVVTAFCSQRKKLLLGSFAVFAVAWYVIGLTIVSH